MIVYRCDFCRKISESEFRSIYFEQGLFDSYYHEQIREHIGMPCIYTPTFQGEKMFKFQICGDCFKDIGNTILNGVGIDKK